MNALRDALVDAGATSADTAIPSSRLTCDTYPSAGSVAAGLAKLRGGPGLADGAVKSRKHGMMTLWWWEGAVGWFFPTAARKAHFDPGTGLALCGKWARGAFGRFAPIQAGRFAPASPDDCAACRRKVDAENAA